MDAEGNDKPQDGGGGVLGVALGTWLEELEEGGEVMNWKGGCNFDRPSVL